MAITRDRGPLERGAAADFRRRTLSHIPTHFGRLIYLASLRSFHDGRYEHHGLALVFGPEESHQALAEAHFEIFQGWINSRVSDQKRDLDEYLSALRCEKRTVIVTWTRLQPYKNLVPAAASASERELFYSDFEALLRLLTNVYGVACPDPAE